MSRSSHIAIAMVASAAVILPTASLAEGKTSQARRAIAAAQAKIDASNIVGASGDAPAGLQFAAPYAAMTIGEYFMRQGLPFEAAGDDDARRGVAQRAGYHDRYRRRRHARGRPVQDSRL